MMKSEPEPNAYLFLIVLFSLMQIVASYGQGTTAIRGRVTDEQGQGLTGALVRIKGRTHGTSTGKEGEFSLRQVAASDTLIVSYLGYHSKELLRGNSVQPFTIVLKPNTTALQEVEVLSTGYQDIPRERATGSFVQVNQELLNRRVSTDILSKLDGVAGGVYFNRTGGMLGQAYTLPNSLVSVNPANKLGINIRGQSTLSNLVSKDPLIVVDNFPYEGDINNLNPESVASVTVLKDAAAASIWGARAGNGVIVITTKKGKLQQKMQIDVTANSTIGNKPDVFADKNFLDAAGYISVEDSLYHKGYLATDINNNFLFPALSPAVSVWEKRRLGELDEAEAAKQIEAYKKQDVRYDIENYVYQPSHDQQYALTARGGAENVSYALGLGYDKNRSSLKGNGYERITFNSSQAYTPAKNLEVTAGIIYSHIQKESNNAFPWGSSNYSMGGSSYSGMYPYARLAGDSGEHLNITKKLSQHYIDSVGGLGFLDWGYSPLKELEAADNTTKQDHLILKTGARYRLSSLLHAELNYQYERQVATERNHYSPDSWYARDLINQFSQFNPATGVISYPVPNNGILNLSTDESVTHNFRGQLNYSQVFNLRHALHAFAGTEIRQARGEGHLRTSYGYDDKHGTSVNYLDYVSYYNTNAGYGGSIPAPAGNLSGTVNRFLSYYANAAYTYNGRYTATVSARRDGSNIFGVNTNNKFAPLWSAGLAWEISKEPFYAAGFLPYLKLRGTYGYNGNVYNGSAFTTGLYSTATLTRLPYLTSLTPPNPELRWEKVRNVNLGIDFEMKPGRVSGTLEFYVKRGTDLIDNIPLFASSGFTSFTGNAAGTKTRGMDLTLNSLLINRKFSWNTSLLVSTLKDKVLEYHVPQTSGSIQSGAVALEGKPLYGVYSYKWAGLNPQNGNPQGYLGGLVSEDYAAIINNFDPDSLAFHGSARPTVFGSWRNDFSYRGISLSVNIRYKGGYYFRRQSTSLNYMDVISSGGHADYYLRWQQPGDEQRTSVPSLVYTANAYRNTFYTYSEQLVEKADHIRLQDIRLAYLFGKGPKKLPLRQLLVFAYFNNLGILWRSNKRQLDPDALGSSLPDPLTISLGIRLGL